MVLDYITFLLLALLSIIGGVLGYVFRSLEKEEAMTYAKAIVQGLGAGFVGCLFILACFALEIDILWTGVIVGFSGWLGANASIRVMEKLVYKKLGIS